jgi:hypothetical protein
MLVHKKEGRYKERTDLSLFDVELDAKGINQATSQQVIVN